jgi:hypothetical protein
MHFGILGIILKSYDLENLIFQRKDQLNLLSIPGSKNAIYEGN